MKYKYLSFISAFCIGLAGYAQTPRMILLEHFTQASCGPCATQNPAVQTILDASANQGKVISVKYQTSWPGTDPMNEHNPGDVATRVSRFGVTGVPNSVIDGNVFNGFPTEWDQSTLDTRLGEDSPMELTLSHDFDPGLDSIRLTLKIKASENISGNNLTAHLVVIEEEINFAVAPGSNGERNFHNVMKKMIPNADGTSIGSTFTSGDSMIVTGSWKFANVYDYNQLAAVAWVENATTREVYQASYSPKKTFQAIEVDEAGIESVSDLPLNTCTGAFDAKVTIRNNGSSNLTSANINYSVNGGTMETVAWTGNLGLLSTDEVILPISYTPGTSDNIEITVSDPNGNTDPYDENNVHVFDLEKAENVQNYMFFTLRLDQNAYQTSWELIRDSDGAIVRSGDSYGQMAGQSIEQLWVLDDGECYTFKIKDSGNDGMTLGSFYRIQSGDNKFVQMGSLFGSGESVSFTGDASLELTKDTTGWTGIEAVDLMSFDVTPNPTSELVNIEFSSNQVESIALYDNLGKLVMTEVTKGRSNTQLNLAKLPNGVYTLKATSPQGVYQEKIVKQ